LATGEKYKKNCETPDIVAQKPRDEICSKSFKNQRKSKKIKEKQRKTKKKNRHNFSEFF
jgi:hypothetical protein